MLSRIISLFKLAASVFVFTLTCILNGGVAEAGTYEYYPGSVLRLAGTFNPEDLTVSYPPCIAYGREFAVHRLNRDSGGPQDSLSPGQAPNVAAQNELAIQQLRTRESLYSFLDVSVAASGHYGFFSASASVHAQNEDSFDSDSFVFGVRGVSTFAEIGLINPQLTQEAKVLAKNTTAFHKRCGREWVSEETRGVLIAVVYNIKNVSKSQRSLLEAAVSGGYNSPGLGVDISANMTKILKTAFTSNAYSATIHFIGGKGVSDFAQTITSMDDPVAVIKSISDYMKTLDYASSVPLKFSTGSLDQFLASETPDGLFDTYNRRIADLFLQYEDYRSERGKVWQYLSQDANSKWGPTLDQKAWSRLLTLDGKLGLIEAKAQTCRRAAQIASDIVDAQPLGEKAKGPAIAAASQRKQFVRDFAVGLSASLVGSNTVNYANVISKLASGSNPPLQSPMCPSVNSGSTDLDTGRSALCTCLNDDGIYLQSRFPIASTPHVTVFHDHETLKPRSLLYVSVVSNSDLTSVKLIDAHGATVTNLTGGFDPEQGPVWYGSTLFRDGSGNPPSADRLPYVVQVTDTFGRTFTKPVVPLD